MLKLLTVAAHDSSSVMRVLQFIDPYGDTVLNGPQQEAALADLDTLSALAAIAEQRDVIGRVGAAIAAAQAKPHRYLRFVGD